MLSQNINTQYIGSINGLIIISSVLLVLIYNVFNVYDNEYKRLKEQYENVKVMQSGMSGFFGTMVSIEYALIKISYVNNVIVGRKGIMVTAIGILLICYAMAHGIVYLHAIPLFPIDYNVGMNIFLSICSVTSVGLLIIATFWMLKVKSVDSEFIHLEYLFETIRNQMNDSDKDKSKSPIDKAVKEVWKNIRKKKG